ncbi:MAG: [protein-PII] uridylyltransferase [Nitrospirae bacterium]|nr:[protein-PII] uridylyltransferase [Nitrospirota bacterium]
MKDDICLQWCQTASELITRGSSGKSIVFELTALVDEVLAGSFRAATLRSAPDDLALVAIGGYGRSEIVPFSDIDIMLLSRGRDDNTAEAAESVFYKLWDFGLNISHSFRALDECVTDALNDPKTRTSFIDSRFVAGNKALYNEFIRDIYPKILFKKKQTFVGSLLSEVQARHKTFEDSVYLLEPNVKDGIGGLRDMHTLTWLSRVILKIDNVSGLASLLASNDYQHLIKAFDFLLRARLGLHIISQRKNEVLSFEYQDAVARLLGFKNTKRFVAAEIMMRLYYKKSEVIRGVLGRIMNISGRRYIHFPLNLSIKRITDDFYLAKNEITVKDKTIFRSNEKIMEAFGVYSVSGRKFSSQVRENIRGRALFISRKARMSRKAVNCFLDILKGNRVYETLREMHEMGILDRFIPEFGRLRHLVIYEIYHRYTVDEHSLLAVRNLEALKNTRHAKLGYLSDILKGTRQHILFLAILLHDIGKGGYVRIGGNHEESGYKMLKAVIERFNIEHEDRNSIEFLVRNHILLSKLALNRDSEAPETVTQLAEIVENGENLDLLYLMTYADMTAVSPDFWTEWKAYLFHDLYVKTKDHLRGVKAKEYRTSDTNLRGFIESMPDRYVIANTSDILRSDYMLSERVRSEVLATNVLERPDGTAEITVATKDRPGLFSKIVGVLSRRGLNILRARIYTSKNAVALDKVLLSNWNAIWWKGLEEELKEELSRSIVEGAQIRPDFGTIKAAAAGRTLDSFIEIDNETSASHTLLEIFLPDRIGLLYDIAEQLYLNRIDIASAVINTEEGVAQDVFYLQHDGSKLANVFILKILGALYGSEIEKREVTVDRL